MKMNKNREKNQENEKVYNGKGTEFTVLYLNLTRKKGRLKFFTLLLLFCIKYLFFYPLTFNVLKTKVSLYIVQIVI